LVRNTMCRTKCTKAFNCSSCSRTSWPH